MRLWRWLRARLWPDPLADKVVVAFLNTGMWVIGRYQGCKRGLVELQEPLLLMPHADGGVRLQSVQYLQVPAAGLCSTLLPLNSLTLINPLPMADMEALYVKAARRMYRRAAVAEAVRTEEVAPVAAPAVVPEAPQRTPESRPDKAIVH